jgi:hypothetical protein
MKRLWVIRPCRTVRHSAPGPLATSAELVSYISRAFCSSPKAAIRVVLISDRANGVRKAR